MIFGIAGVFFGLLAGWMIGAQQGRGAPAAPVQTAPAAQSAPQTAPRLDEAEAARLRAAADKDTADAASRVRLGNLYFDAERYDDAIKWYEEALKIDPANVNASTDLGIAYYYVNQVDRALAQFDRSLSIDPKHTKTLLNVGIVRAFGKQDLSGAAEVWQRVLELAPDSQEARMAKQALDGLRSAHPDASGGAAPASRGK